MSIVRGLSIGRRQDGKERLGAAADLSRLGLPAAGVVKTIGGLDRITSPGISLRTRIRKRFCMYLLYMNIYHASIHIQQHVDAAASH